MRRRPRDEDEGEREEAAGEDGVFETAPPVRTFLLAGNARITLRSLATGARFSFRVKRAPGTAPDKKRPWFVSILTGSDNETSYEYFGEVWRNGSMLSWSHGRKARIGLDAPSARAWDYFFTEVIIVGRMPPKLEVWHEGRCGRCGRALTVPESIASGLGPECRGKGLL